MRVAIADDSALLRQGLARLLTDDGCDSSAHIRMKLVDSSGSSSVPSPSP